MPADPKPTPHQPTPAPAPSGGHTDQQETKPAEEWGERIDTGKRIARGGKEHGHVPGSDESH